MASANTIFLEIRIKGDFNGYSIGQMRATLLHTQLRAGSLCVTWRYIPPRKESNHALVFMYMLPWISQGQKRNITKPFTSSKHLNQFHNSYEDAWKYSNGYCYHKKNFSDATLHNPHTNPLSHYMQWSSHFTLILILLWTFLTNIYGVGYGRSCEELINRFQFPLYMLVLSKVHQHILHLLAQ